MSFMMRSLKRFKKGFKYITVYPKIILDRNAKV